MYENPNLKHVTHNAKNDRAEFANPRPIQTMQIEVATLATDSKTSIEKFQVLATARNKRYSKREDRKLSVSKRNPSRTDPFNRLPDDWRAYLPCELSRASMLQRPWQSSETKKNEDRRNVVVSLLVSHGSGMSRAKTQLIEKFANPRSYAAR
jgi:hypothetical protein